MKTMLSFVVGIVFAAQAFAEDGEGIPGRHLFYDTTAPSVLQLECHPINHAGERLYARCDACTPGLGWSYDSDKLYPLTLIECSAFQVLLSKPREIEEGNPLRETWKKATPKERKILRQKLLQHFCGNPPQLSPETPYGLEIPAETATKLTNLCDALSEATFDPEEFFSKEARPLAPCSMWLWTSFPTRYSRVAPGVWRNTELPGLAVQSYEEMLRKTEGRWTLRIRKTVDASLASLGTVDAGVYEVDILFTDDPAFSTVPNSVCPGGIKLSP